MKGLYRPSPSRRPRWKTVECWCALPRGPCRRAPTLGRAWRISGAALAFGTLRPSSAQKSLWSCLQGEYQLSLMHSRPSSLHRLHPSPGLTILDRPGPSLPILPFHTGFETSQEHSAFLLWETAVTSPLHHLCLQDLPSDAWRGRRGFPSTPDPPVHLGLHCPVQQAPSPPSSGPGPEMLPPLLYLCLSGNSPAPPLPTMGIPLPPLLPEVGIPPTLPLPGLGIPPPLLFQGEYPSFPLFPDRDSSSSSTSSQ